jgi:hypothetical protein
MHFGLAQLDPAAVKDPFREGGVSVVEHDKRLIGLRTKRCNHPPVDGWENCDL